jgi:hypothetical protein
VGASKPGFGSSPYQRRTATTLGTSPIASGATWASRKRTGPGNNVLSVSVHEVVGELRGELTGDGTITGAAVAVGLARALDP